MTNRPLADDLPAERLALVLARHGMQRMTARVLAAFLFTEQQTLTMADLAEALTVSAGSVHGAVKGLMKVGLIEQVPAPGSRRDHFRIRDDAWPTLFSAQNLVTQAMVELVESALPSTTGNGPARRRLEEMHDFYVYMLRELPGLIDRWRAQR